MWSLIPQKGMPPTRIARYCCAILKETSGKNRFIATGARWAESTRRKNSIGIYGTMPSDPLKRINLNNDNDDTRRLFETCTLKAKRVCNPLVDWSDEDIWNYAHDRRLILNPVYQMGFNRVGCIGCPMAGCKMRQIEFAIWPKYKQNYLSAFDRMLRLMEEKERKEKKFKTDWTDAKEVYHWWMEDGVLPGQMDMFDIFEEVSE